MEDSIRLQWGRGRKIFCAKHVIVGNDSQLLRDDVQDANLWSHCGPISKSYADEAIGQSGRRGFKHA